MISTGSAHRITCGGLSRCDSDLISPAKRSSAARIAASSFGVLVASVQQGLDLCVRLLVNTDESVWMEDPGYPAARSVLEAADAKTISVPVDAEGLDVAAGRSCAPSAKLVYVTAGRQYPLGVTLSLRRRLELLRWAEQSGAVIFEDDYDSEFCF